MGSQPEYGPWKPGFIQYKQENILEATEKYILNITHTFGHKIDNINTEHIYREFPHSNLFTNREFNISQLGSIHVHGALGGENEERGVINLIAQRKPDYPQWTDDTWHKRQRFFISSMNKVYRIKNLDSVAIPNYFGCIFEFSGVTNWNNYHKLIEKYAAKYPAIRTVMYMGKYAKRKVNRTEDNLNIRNF